MANFTVVIDGIPMQVPTPDGLSTGGQQDWLIQSGFDPADVGIAQDNPEQRQSLGAQALQGAGESISDLFPGLQSPIRAPDTLAADIGRGAAFAHVRGHAVRGRQHLVQPWRGGE